MTDYKYKVTRETSNGIITVETSDVGFVRDICEVGIEKVSVNTPNESIDPDWQGIMKEIQEGLNKRVNPLTPSDDHIIPMTSVPLRYPFVTNDSSPYTVTC